MPRKKSTDKEKIQKLKKELADCVQNRKDKLYFWATTEMYCPHCRGTFSYRQMWEALVRDLRSVEAIMDKIDRSWNEVHNHLRRYKLRAGILRSRENINWYRRAEVIGYDSPEELFYDLRVIKRMTWSRIGLICGNIGSQNARDACQLFLQIPKKSKKKGGEKNAQKKEGGKRSKGN